MVLCGGGGGAALHGGLGMWFAVLCPLRAPALSLALMQPAATRLHLQQLLSPTPQPTPSVHTSTPPLLTVLPSRFLSYPHPSVLHPHAFCPTHILLSYTLTLSSTPYSQPERVERFLVVHGQILLNQIRLFPKQAVQRSAFVGALKERMATRRHFKLYAAPKARLHLRAGVNRNPMKVGGEGGGRAGGEGMDGEGGRGRGGGGDSQGPRGRRRGGKGQPGGASEVQKGAVLCGQV